MTYQGFPSETPAFLAELKANNRKDWFEANRARYEALWRDAGLSLIEALQPFCNAAIPRLEAVPKIGGALRRIHRDTRFSADKAPYTPMLHIVLTPSGGARHTGFHLVVHPDSVGYGAGQYGLAPEELARFRARVSDPKDRARLLKAVAAAEAVGSAWDAPDLKRLPKGFEADDSWEHLLRRKSVIVRASPSGLPGWLTTPQCLTEVERLATAHLPLLAWLSE